ncbi:MAG: BMP family ABC transporter substrate-binding protein [Bacillota bacterium]|nr:BMP family ABC transporter substrate-binding protein [Bacillota bacterium]
MKKILAVLLALAMVFTLAACGEKEEAQTEAPAFAVAMITDYGDITDESFNQATYEGCKEFCEANGVNFNYYKPAGDSDAERVAMIDAAIADGFNVIVTPGYAFAGALKETVGTYPDAYFIALDVSEGDFGDFEIPANLFSAVYQEELCGYMAGVAAVKLGYKHVGFLGGMAVPAVVRYGYGFVQGANAAAEELGLTDVVCEYGYGNQFFGDADITAVMDTWYQTLGVEVVFACGGGIYTSAAEAAAKVGGKVIGVDVDQVPTIDGTYGAGMTVTSAMKGLAATVKTLLTELILNNNWSAYGGTITKLGLVSGTDTAANYVQLGTTQWADGFTEADYQALVAAMFDGSVKVSDSIDAMPTTTITVNDHGNVK